MKKNIPSLITRIALASLAISLSSSSHAAVLVGFDFANGHTNNPASTSNAVGVGPSSLGFGAGLGFGSTVYTSGFTVSPDGPDTFSEAKTDGEYLDFTVTPTSGNTATLTNLSLNVASFGGATDLALTDTSDNVLSSTSVGNSDGVDYHETPELSFGTGGLAISSPTTFRLFLYGNQLEDSSGDNGSPYTLVFNSGDSVGDSFDIDGAVAPTLTPEPSTFTLLGLGALALIMVGRRGMRKV